MTGERSIENRKSWKWNEMLVWLNSPLNKMLFLYLKQMCGENRLSFSIYSVQKVSESVQLHPWENIIYLIYETWL